MSFQKEKKIQLIEMNGNLYKLTSKRQFTVELRDERTEKLIVFIWTKCRWLGLFWSFFIQYWCQFLSAWFNYISSVYLFIAGCIKLLASSKNVCVFFAFHGPQNQRDFCNVSHLKWLNLKPVNFSQNCPEPIQKWS